MKCSKVLLVVLSCLLFFSSYAQVVNINPDPEGNPWITGGVPNITPEIMEKINQTPRMTLTQLGYFKM